MNRQQIFFLVIIFMVVFGIALLAMLIFSSGPLHQRLLAFMGPERVDAERGADWIERAAKVAQPFTRLSAPEEGWERSPLRTRFMNAGWRNPASATLYFGAKSVLALLFPALLALFGSHSPALRQSFLFLLLLSAGIGYYLPNVILAHSATRRQREIFESIPDALDLLTVCVEAGLSLEQGLVKVTSEIHIKSVILAQELQLLLLEMRAGFTREKALRNLALRSGVDDIDSLVAMLIQSERFGTSMGDALRVYSDNLRSKRSIIAEEAAEKIALKLLFPLIFCIFPTLMLVLLGPAMIQIYRVLLPSMAGTTH